MASKYSDPRAFVQAATSAKDVATKKRPPPVHPYALRIPEPLWLQLRARIDADTSAHALIVRAIEEFLERNEK